MQNYHLLNLRSMIQALELINEQLQTDNTQFTFDIDNIPWLTQPYNIKELIGLSKIVYSQSTVKKQQPNQLESVYRELNQFFKESKEFYSKIQQLDQSNLNLPVNICTIALRLKVTQKQVQNFSKQLKANYDPKPLLNYQKYRELYEYVKSYKHKGLISLQQLAEQFQLNEEIQVEPYHDINDVATDIIIMIQNLYITGQYGKTKLESVLNNFIKILNNKKIHRKQVPEYISKCLDQNYINRLNHVIKPTEFDTVDFSTWTDQSILTVLGLLQIDKSNQSREDISDQAMQAAIEYIRKEREHQKELWEQQRQ